MSADREVLLSVAASSCLVLPEAAGRCRQAGRGALWFASWCDDRAHQEDALRGGDTVQRLIPKGYSRG